MTYTATSPGEWPRGVYWTAGEARDIETDEDPPAWLEPVKAASARHPAPTDPVEGE